MKEVVRVSRKWKETEVKTYVKLCKEQIGAEMSLSDFLHAISKEFAGIAITMTKKQHEKKLKEAAEKVIKEMKREIRVSL